MKTNETFDKKIIGQAKNVKIKNGVLSFDVVKQPMKQLKGLSVSFKSLIKEPIIRQGFEAIMFGYVVIATAYLTFKLLTWLIL